MFDLPEPTLASRSTLAELLGAPGGHHAVLALIRRQVLREMLLENPLLIRPQDPWRENLWNQRTQVVPVIEPRREVRFITGRVVALA